MKQKNTNLPQPEKQMIARCKKGDKEAFREIIKLYQEFVRNTIFKLVFNTEETNDLSQTVFIKVWQNITRYNDDYLFSTWLYRIAVNCCYDYLKSSRVRRSQGITTDYEDQSETVDSTIENKDLVKRIKRISRKLSAKQRIVFVLKDLQDWSIEEVSEVMNMSKGTIKSNLYYARKYIREQLIELEDKEKSYELQRSR